MGITMRQHKILLAGLFLLSSLQVLAERKTVLAQIQLPHNYYYREMYLPQLTSGPSALTFSPDGKVLVYSMGGSLWRQTIGSDEARELTHAGGYDYQPDWSHDGRHIIFTQVAFVSTADSGDFNLYVAEIAGDRLSASKRLVPEHTSTVYRYLRAHRARDRSFFR